MKSQPLPSFFFFFVICSFFCSGVFGLFAQQVSDSASYYHELLKSPTQSDDLIRGYFYYEKQKEANLREKDTIEAIQNLRRLAIIQFDLGLLQESEISTVEALALLDKMEGKESLKSTRRGMHNQLGKIYRQLENHTLALSHYDRALIFTDNLVDSIIILNNKGSIYNDLKDYERAIHFFETAYLKSVTICDSLQMSRTLDNLSFVRVKTGDETAYKTLFEALEMRELNSDFKGMYASYRHLVRLALDRDDKKQALQYAEKALQIARTINSLTFLKDALSLFIEAQGDTVAYNYIKVSDSLQQLRQAQENKYASMKYDLDKEREKTKTSLLLQEKEKKQKQLYQALGAIVSLIAIFVIYILVSGFRKQKQQEIYKTETRISKKVHDEVANDVYQVMTKLQMKKNNQAALLDDLEEIYIKTRDISKESSVIDVNQQFDEVLKDLLLGYQSEETNIITRNISKVNWDLLSEYKKQAVYRVLQELMTNMKKHSRATFVVVSFTQNGQKVSIDYKDNGMGCELSKHTGLQNAENRIHAIKGSITFESANNEGFKVKIMV